jgi:hypothetical protein
MNIDTLLNTAALAYDLHLALLAAQKPSEHFGIACLRAPSAIRKLTLHKEHRAVGP